MPIVTEPTPKKHRVSPWWALLLLPVLLLGLLAVPLVRRVKLTFGRHTVEAVGGTWSATDLGNVHLHQGINSLDGGEPFAAPGTHIHQWHLRLGNWVYTIHWKRQP